MSFLTALGVAHVALPGAATTGLLHATVTRVARLLPLHNPPPAPGLRALHEHSSPVPASPNSAVPVVPGTLFRIQAGANEVRVQHVAGWSDVATVQGQPGAGIGSAAAGQWRVEVVSAEAATAAAGGGAATAAAGGGAATAAAGGGAATAAAGGGAATAAAGGGAAATASEQAGAGSGFTGQPTVSLRYEVTPAQQGRGGGGDAGGGGGVLTLSVPEKWISLDVSTEGEPLSVSRLVEADLAANTAGGAVRLGAIRGLDVHVDTSRTTPNDTGSVTGGDVSGTRVAVVAGGAIDLRRVVGGVMVLTSLASSTSPSAPASTSSAASGLAVSSAPPALAASGSAAAVASAAPHSIPAAVVRLGAVYGGSLSLSTRGGDVRIGTLDCGGHPGVPGLPATGGSSSSAGSSSSSGSSNTGGGGAEVTSSGGRITVDGLEGYAVLDSGGGDVKVLAGAGLRHAVIRTAGGALDCALDPGTALELVEVRQAGRLDLDPGLEPHLRPAAPVAPETAAWEPAGGSSSGSGSSSSSGSSSGSGNGVWRASVAAEPVGGRGGIRGSNAAAVVGAEPASAASGGRLVVEAGGGAVRLRRLGWMEALKAKMAEKQELSQ